MQKLYNSNYPNITENKIFIIYIRVNHSQRKLQLQEQQQRHPLKKTYILIHLFFSHAYKKFILSFIENKMERKVSYKKSHIGLLKKIEELNTLYDIEIALVICSPYGKEAKLFPNLDSRINTFKKFNELEAMER